MKHPTLISRALRFLVPVALGAVVLAPVPAAPAAAAPKLASTMGVYPGFDQGGRFAAHERSLNADLSWAVHMSGRESPAAMRSSVWGQVTKPDAYLAKLSSRVNLVMTIPLVFGTRTAKTAADRVAIGKDLRATAAGLHDEDFRVVARQLIEAGYPDTVIRLGHEFDGDYYSWSARDNNEAFIAAYRHVHDVFASESAAFRFEWTGMRNTFATYGPPAYPGDAYVDVVGLDIYYRNKESMTDQVWTRQYEDQLEFHRDFAISHGKPVAYSEWAVALYDHPEFIDAMYGWFNSLPTSGPGRLLYQSYFNPPRSGYNLSQLPKSHARYMSLFSGMGGRAESPAELTKPPVDTTAPPVTTNPPPATTNPPPSTTETTAPPASGGSVQDAEFTLFDQRVVHQVDRYADLDFAAAKWDGRANFVQGAALLRLDIVDKPTDRPVQVLVCMWQKGFSQETCVSAGRFATTGEHWITLRSPGLWWRKGQWDWSTPIEHVRLMVKDVASGSLLSTQRCGAACYSGSGNPADHAPITFDTELVIVAKGALLAPDSAWAGCPASFQCGSASGSASTSPDTTPSASTTPTSLPRSTVPASAGSSTPKLYIRSAVAKEGSSLGFRLMLSAPSSSAVSVELRSQDISATAGKDYRPISKTVTIPAGERTAWIGIATIKDGVGERPEKLRLRVLSVSGAAAGTRTAIGIIRD